ncbi:ATPase [Gammaproteobacteria bacterium AH-315-C21]|nr:ATPase [Gammaproteobacteria bacterium AH-315-C21]
MPKKAASTTQSGQNRNDRLIQEFDHDPYHAKLKLKEPTACPQCCAVYEKGRWSWAKIPADAHETLCPACQRIHDHAPAAFLTLSGPFLVQHKEEILHLIDNYEQREAKQHPLKRRMSCNTDNEIVHMTFTELHLAHGIGEALENAYKGDLDYQYNKGEYMLRVTWSR